ncbi:MAG: hypothetical protein LBJ18_00240 [Rickettsiales bacterium]|nr:hypothetical protein [Rickettsiales bacterium]
MNRVCFDGAYYSTYGGLSPYGYNSDYMYFRGSNGYCAGLRSSCPGESYIQADTTQKVLYCTSGYTCVSGSYVLCDSNAFLINDNCVLLICPAVGTDGQVGQIMTNKEDWYGDDFNLSPYNYWQTVDPKVLCYAKLNHNYSDNSGTFQYTGKNPTIPSQYLADYPGCMWTP